MISDTQSILGRHVEVYERTILNYVEAFKDNMIGRKIVPVRKVGESVETDVIQLYDKKGASAVIAAKGTVPSGTGSKVTTTTFQMYQILAGFDIHEKDVKADPKLKARNVDICMKQIHWAEDEFVLNGQTNLNVDGITDNIPAGNQISAANNNGAWSAVEANDIHQDILNAIRTLDTNFQPSWLLANPADLTYLKGLDSERQPYWKTIVDLFPGASSFKDFTAGSSFITAGKVYIGCKDPDAAELVVASNPKVQTRPIQRGGVYPVEIAEWVTFEKHNDDCFASIVIT